MTATTALRSEHNHILAMIACLRAACAATEKGASFDAETFRKGVDFIRNYADAWHHAKEEDLLFPALEEEGMPRDGGPIAVMLHEHTLGRTYVRQVAGEIHAFAAEVLLEAGQARVHRITPAVDNPGAGKQHLDQPQVEEVGR